MSIVKHSADFFMRHILRRGRPQDIEGKAGEVIDHDEPTRTLRTFPVDGDPFDDRIEFHLGKGPGGFRDPR